MKTVLTLSACLLGSLLFAAEAGATPVIDSTYPHILVRDGSTPTVQNVSILGSGLALPTTTGFTAPNDISLWAMWTDEGVWHRASNTDPWLRQNTWGMYGLDFTLIGVPRAGTLKVAVCVGSVATCAFHDLTVREWAVYPPVVYSPNHVRLRRLAPGAGTFWDRQVAFTAANLNSYETTRVFVGWRDAYLSTPFFAGDGTGYFQTSMQDSTGSYPVWIGNDVGWTASPGSVNVWDVPWVITTPAAVSGLPATVPLTFHDPFTRPDGGTARLLVAGCPTVTVSLAATAGNSFNAYLPASCRPGWASYDATLELSNFTGTTTVVVPVRPTVVIKPGPGL